MKGKLIEKIHKQYVESKRYFDAWGIVINLTTYEKLTVECLEHYDANYNVLQIGDLESIFGMVVILDNEVADNDAIIVDERFGRSILGKKTKQTQQEQWINVNGELICPRCLTRFYEDITDQYVENPKPPVPRFCLQCGQDMRGAK